MKKALLMLSLMLLVTTSWGQVIFKPTKATIYDSEGQYSSTNFNCPNMSVYDKGAYVLLRWNGETIKLFNSRDDSDTYTDSQTKYDTTIKFTAYRSSSSREVYLVVVSTISNSQRMDINFKKRTNY